jgi:hypothetical protein
MAAITAKPPPHPTHTRPALATRSAELTRHRRVTEHEHGRGLDRGRSQGKRRRNAGGTGPRRAHEAWPGDVDEPPSAKRAWPSTGTGAPARAGAAEQETAKRKRDSDTRAVAETAAVADSGYARRAQPAWLQEARQVYVDAAQLSEAARDGWSAAVKQYESGLPRVPSPRALAADCAVAALATTADGPHWRTGCTELTENRRCDTTACLTCDKQLRRCSYCNRHLELTLWYCECSDGGIDPAVNEGVSLHREPPLPIDWHLQQLLARASTPERARWGIKHRQTIDSEYPRPGYESSDDPDMPELSETVQHWSTGSWSAAQRRGFGIGWEGLPPTQGVLERRGPTALPENRGLSFGESSDEESYAPPAAASPTYSPDPSADERDDAEAAETSQAAQAEATDAAAQRLAAPSPVYSPPRTPADSGEEDEEDSHTDDDVEDMPETEADDGADDDGIAGDGAADDDAAEAEAEAEAAVQRWRQPWLWPTPSQTPRAARAAARAAEHERETTDGQRRAPVRYPYRHTRH